MHSAIIKAKGWEGRLDLYLIESPLSVVKGLLYSPCEVADVNKIEKATGLPNYQGFKVNVRSH